MHRGTSVTLAAALGVVLSLAAAGCSETITQPTENPPVTATQVYIDTLAVGGTSKYFFAVEQAMFVRATLAGLLASDGVTTVDRTLELKVGKAIDTECSPLMTIDTQPRLTAQLPVYIADPGLYCAQVTDKGGLSAPVDVVLRVVLAPPTSTTSTASTTWESNLAPDGGAQRTFSLGTAGSIRVGLASLGAPTGATARLTLGIFSDDFGCVPVKTLRTPAGSGPQIVVDGDIGVYCVAVSDLSVAQSQTPFAVTITHP